MNFTWQTAIVIVAVCAVIIAALYFGNDAIAELIVGQAVEQAVK